MNSVFNINTLKFYHVTKKNILLSKNKIYESRIYDQNYYILDINNSINTQYLPICLSISNIIMNNDNQCIISFNLTIINLLDSTNMIGLYDISTNKCQFYLNSWVGQMTVSEKKIYMILQTKDWIIKSFLYQKN